MGHCYPYLLLPWNFCFPHSSSPSVSKKGWRSPQNMWVSLFSIWAKFGSELSGVPRKAGRPITYKIYIVSKREINSITGGRAGFPGWDLREAWLGMPVGRKQCMKRSSYNKCNRYCWWDFVHSSWKVTIWLSQSSFPIDMHHNLKMCSWLLWQGHPRLGVILTFENPQSIRTFRCMSA